MAQTPDRRSRQRRATGRKPHQRRAAIRETGRDAQASGYQLRDDQVEKALLTGEHAGFLEDYFGEEGYHELREMSQAGLLALWTLDSMAPLRN